MSEENNKKPYFIIFRVKGFRLFFNIYFLEFFEEYANT